MSNGKKQTAKSFCRFCHANCAIEVDIENGRATALRGDPSDPMFGGYTCLKGRELVGAHYHPDRLHTSLKRQEDGTFAEIPTDQALDEIARRLADIISHRGPRAVATYNGTYAFQNSAALAVARAFHAAIGSPSFYTSVTIDQPAKSYTWSRFGSWGGGTHSFKDSDVSIIIGNNPLVAHYSPAGGVPPFSPSRRLRDAVAAGHQIIVIDPRRTETARLAQMHLQVRPGEDATLLAGIVHIILNENLHDHEFCARYVDGLDQIRNAVSGFTPDYVALRTDVPQDQIIAAARLFARGPRGIATTGTGPEMALRGTLTHHFVMTLNTICGRFYREGEISSVPQVLMPAIPRRAEVIPPAPLWGTGQTPSRLRGLTALAGEMPCATIAEEILLPGDGQIRALVCVGGNPIVAWPDQDLTRRALEDLDLLVAIDTRLSATARHAHYVIAPQMCLERDDMTVLSEWWYEEPYSNYAGALLEAPPATIDEWEFFWELARRLGRQINLPGGPLDMEHRPSKFEVMEKITAGSKVPLAKIREETRGKGGKVFPEGTVRVAAGNPSSKARFVLMPDGVDQDIAVLCAEPLDDHGRPVAESDFTHRLISRRTRHVFNSTGHDLPALVKDGGTTNFAHMHPDDLAALGVQSGALVRIESAAGWVLGVVRASEDVRPGVVSMAHGFGGTDTDPESVRKHGLGTNRLVSTSRDYDPITGMVRQSAIPIRVTIPG